MCCTLGKLSAGPIEFFTFGREESCLCFLFSSSTMAKQGFPLPPFLLFVEGVGIFCFQSEMIFPSARQVFLGKLTSNPGFFSNPASVG